MIWPLSPSIKNLFFPYDVQIIILAYSELSYYYQSKLKFNLQKIIIFVLKQGLLYESLTKKISCIFLKVM